MPRLTYSQQQAVASAARNIFNHIDRSQGVTTGRKYAKQLLTRPLRGDNRVYRPGTEIEIPRELTATYLYAQEKKEGTQLTPEEAARRARISAESKKLFKKK